MLQSNNRPEQTDPEPSVKVNGVHHQGLHRPGAEPERAADIAVVQSGGQAIDAGMSVL